MNKDSLQLNKQNSWQICSSNRLLWAIFLRFVSFLSPSLLPILHSHRERKSSLFSSLASFSSLLLSHLFYRICFASSFAFILIFQFGFQNVISPLVYELCMYRICWTYWKLNNWRKTKNHMRMRKLWWCVQWIQIFMKFSFMGFPTHRLFCVSGSFYFVNCSPIVLVLLCHVVWQIFKA